MSKFDYSDVDGRLLKLLLAVIETGSVTRAAERLGVTQSAVSHLLDKLRAITGDPLFVKSGRGIVATAHAKQLAVQAHELLISMERFAASSTFDPAQWDATFTIAANDFQCDVLLPPLVKRLSAVAPKLRLRVIPSGIPSLEMLRDEHCQLVISPRPPDGSDIMQKRLFNDVYHVFYDPTERDAPKTKTEYLQAKHVTVVYAPNRPLDLDAWLLKRGVERQFMVMVPGFAALPSFIRGSDRLATAPSLLQGYLLQDFASCKVPVPCPPIPMYMIWHKRHQLNPAHRWFRQALEDQTPYRSR